MGRVRLAGFFSGLALAALFTAGCAHYQMGTGGRLTFSSLYVEPVKNQTQLAQARAVMSTQLREAFEQDGRLSLVEAQGGAEATLEVTLTNYHREIAANREDDTGLARKFTLFLTATCRLVDNRTGKVLFDKREVTVQTEAFVDNGLGNVPFGLSDNQLQSEYNTLPFLAQDLSKKIAHTVLDVW